MTGRRFVLYVAHGADCFVQEAAYSILSLWRQTDAPPCEVVVVTDRPERFRQLLDDRPSLHLLSLSPEQRDTWRGAQGYIHRIKPLAIQWAAQQMQAQADDAFLYVDSDTVFSHSPATVWAQIEAGGVVLNEREGSLGELRRNTRSHRRLFEACQAHRFQVRGREQQVPLSTGLWNSGVLGFQGRLLPVFDETAQLIDQMLPVVQVHTVEQVALSVVLQDRGLRLHECLSDVFHYHVFKEFRDDLALFFDRYGALPLAERLQHWPEIDPVRRIQPKLAFNALPKWQRQWRKLWGQRWQPLPYPWA
ncbi:hypothetical protein PSQ40_03085 [Curvibacter sp. HBC61]|uniref:Nucleotide-diphospho-sugar transferase domain-containing protein n=1 Tax=Curvibacter cyanobacteriorum TaxID=3026422 RepID=A0ABT5MW44_9BURK|nr:hypothetical protein [Curvibacter sp. HBC61]MDD0837549.1 hypothetical protein [Curvibacter sp. HBC61]